MVEFFYSNLFESIIVLFVGTFAIGLYIWQKRDFKNGIASIILVEIRNAEQSILTVRNRGLDNALNSNDKLLLPNNSWTKYNYLFINDFDVDEWYSINNFINNCLSYDDLLKYYKEDIPYQIRQKEKYIQKKLVDLSAKKFNKEGSYEKRRLEFINKINIENFTFNPNYHSQEILKVILNLDTGLSTSSVGVKLKQIARLEKKRRFLLF